MTNQEIWAYLSNNFTNPVEDVARAIGFTKNETKLLVLCYALDNKDKFNEIVNKKMVPS